MSTIQRYNNNITLTFISESWFGYEEKYIQSCDLSLIIPMVYPYTDVSFIFSGDF